MENIPSSAGSSASSAGPVRGMPVAKPVIVPTASQENITNRVMEFVNSILNCLKNLFCSCCKSLVERELTLEENLGNFFQSNERVSRIFTIHNTEIGIIFNPNGAALSEDIFRISDHVALISRSAIPPEAIAAITTHMRAEDTHSQLIMPKVNGKDIFAHFKLRA